MARSRRSRLTGAGVTMGERGWPFEGLRRFGYDVILADPPWSFENYSAKGELKNPKRHYSCMDAREIAALPVGDLAARDCALFLWVCDPLLREAFDVIRAWGFEYKTVAFNWFKTSKTWREHIGTGYWTRANPELCLLATTGSPKRLDRDVRQAIVCPTPIFETVAGDDRMVEIAAGARSTTDVDTIIAPVREHSRKPDQVRAAIERLVEIKSAGAGRVELFARSGRDGWDSWGLETSKFGRDSEPADQDALFAAGGRGA